MDLSQKIKELRLNQHLTQSELAEKLQVQFQTISKWENGITQPNVNLLPLLADSLNVSIGELFEQTASRCDFYLNKGVTGCTNAERDTS